MDIIIPITIRSAARLARLAVLDGLDRNDLEPDAVHRLRMIRDREARGDLTLSDVTDAACLAWGPPRPRRRAA